MAGVWYAYRGVLWHRLEDRWRVSDAGFSRVGGGGDEGHLGRRGEKGHVERHVRRIDQIWGLIRGPGSELEGMEPDSTGK